MNPDKIWNLFGNTGEGEKKEVFDYTKHPSYGLLMFKKILKNSKDVMKIMHQLSSNEDLNENDINTIGQEYVYRNAWEYLKKTKVDDNDVIASLQFISTPEIESYLEEAKMFFEEKEEYEKCAFIKKIQTSL